MTKKATGWTYARAGVDIAQKSQAIASLVDQLKYRRTGKGRMIEAKGQFAGLIGFGDCALTLATDGVGTKLLVAKALDKWDTVGIDCMAMNVNDTICVGAEPMSFVDYIAIDKPDERITHDIGLGLEKAAEMANVDIVGGEIAVLPELVKGVDLSGTCLGFVAKDRIVDGSKVKVGDAIIGLPSSGLHSNGFTLVRGVLKSNKIGLDHKFKGLSKSIGEEMLTPTSIYVKQVMRLLKKHDVSGMVDVTGGGLRNFIRLKKNVRFEISDPLPPQPIFDVLAELGDIEPLEMYQTFNMGMGFAVVCRPELAKSAVLTLGGDAKVVGRVVRGAGVGIDAVGVEYGSY
jgi:phosphoribosylformylglycinamidine cyclo-ligase